MPLEQTTQKDKPEAASVGHASEKSEPDRLHSELHQTEKSQQKTPARTADVSSKEDAMFKSAGAFAKPIEGDGRHKNGKDEPASKDKPAAKDKAEAGKAKNEPAVLDLGVTIERAKPPVAQAPAGSEGARARSANAPANAPSDKPAPQAASADATGAKSDTQQLLDNAKQYWEDAAKRGTIESGVSGQVSSAGARMMSLGVDAAKAGHKAYDAAFPEGAIDPARRYWENVGVEGAKEGGVFGTAKAMAAATAEALLSVSGLGNVENGSKTVAKDLNLGVPAEQLRSDLKTLGIDTTLAALTFIPGVTGLKALAKGETLYRTAAAGSEIAGMAATESKLAGTVSTKLSTAISETLPAGEQLSKASIQNFVGRLEKIASEYGIKLKQGGIIGESNGTINTIEFSTKAGGRHEVAHAMQQLQTRAVALEGQAAKQGKTVQELTQAERSVAYESVVKPFENIAYNQHEMFAGAAHSWGRTAKNYSEILKNNVSSFDKALSTATVPEAAVKLASRAYGRMPDWLGRSQLSIAKNLGAPASVFLNQETTWKDRI